MKANKISFSFNSLFFLIFSTIISFMIPQNALSQDQEMRSSIHFVDGYAYLSEDMTLSQTRAAALQTQKESPLRWLRLISNRKQRWKIL